MTNRRNFVSMAAVAAGATTAMALSPSVRAQGTITRNHAGTIKTRDGAELFIKDWGRAVRSSSLTRGRYRPIVGISTPSPRRGWIPRDRIRSPRIWPLSQPGGGYDYNTYADDLAAVINSRARGT